MGLNLSRDTKEHMCDHVRVNKYKIVRVLSVISFEFNTRPCIVESDFRKD